MPTPGRTHGRCTRRCATTIRCTTSSRGEARPRLLGAVPARRRLGRRPRPRDVLVGAGPDRQLRRAGTDRPAGQSADGDAGPAGAHRVPQAGVARLHAAAGRGRRAEGPRIRRSSASSASAPTAAATSSPSCSSRCRRWSSRTISGCPEEDREQFDGWTEAIVAAQHRRRRRRRSAGALGDALGEMMAYFTALIERRRQSRRTTPCRISSPPASAPTVTSPGTLSVLAFTFTMVTGGNDTTTGMLGGAVQLLHQRPDQRRLLVKNPDLIPDAVDEFLRLTVAGAGAGRTATRDVHDRRHHRFPQAAGCCCSTGRPTATSASSAPTPAELDVAAAAAQHPDVQPRRALLPWRRRRRACSPASR